MKARNVLLAVHFYFALTRNRVSVTPSFVYDNVSL